MKLSILSIEGDKYEEKKRKFPIIWQAYHIKEIFMHFLPKIEIDGSSKIVIYFKDKPISEKQYMHDEYFGVSWCYVDKEKLQKINYLKNRELEEFYLDVIVEKLKEIARENDNGKNVVDYIDATAERVRKSNFELKIPIKKISKQTKDKKYKALVYRYLNSKGEMWYVDILDKEGLSTRYNILKEFTYTPKNDVFKYSYWEHDCFVLKDKFGKITSSINLNGEVNKL